MRRIGIVAAAVAVLASGLFIDARGEQSPTVTLAGINHRCGGLDNQEPGLQGDVPMASRVEGPDGISPAEKGFNCGLALVGRTTLDAGGRNGSQNANMAWSQDCAYVSGSGGAATFGPTTYDPAKDDPNGIAVVDVSDPTAPVHVRTLSGRAGSTKTSETIYAMDVPADNQWGRPERHVLVVGQYGNAGSGVLKPMDIYDVSNCADPKFLATYLWPDNIHNLTISANGKYVFATQPLQMLDIDPLFDADPATGPVFVGNVELDMPYPLVPFGSGAEADDALPAEVREANRRGYSSHQVWTSPDGTRLYVGAQTPQYEVFTIVDIRDWITASPAERATTKRPKILSQGNGRGHSVSVASIDGQGTWAMHAEESVFGQANDCADAGLPLPATHTLSPNYGADPFVGVAEPFLSNVTDPERPTMHVSRLGLQINRVENCEARKASGVQASVHYHEFDREQNARFAIASMQNAGIRVFDVRDPAAPSEVAYFNPGDVFSPKDDPNTPQNEAADNTVTLDYAWGHPRFVPEKNQIWFATRTGGFWVVELEGKLRRYFGIQGVSAPRRPTVQPAGSA